MDASINEEMTMPGDGKTFAQILESLFAEERIPIHLLFHLSDMAEHDMAHFEREWRSVDDERRRIIVRHLADISEENTVVDFSPVFARCLGDESALVRLAALDGLWDATDVSLVEPVIQLLQTDESIEVRESAASALAHFILLAEWGQLPEAVSTTIVGALLAEYDSPATAFAVKRAALEALGTSSHPRLGTIILEAYESDEPEMQLSAVFAMGGSADPRWLPILADEMTNESALMREEAARAAGSIGDEAAITDLASLAFDEDEAVALAAVVALGQIGGSRAGSVLIEMTRDPHLEALHEAIDEALEEIAWLNGSIDIHPSVNDEFPAI